MRITRSGERRMFVIQMKDPLSNDESNNPIKEETIEDLNNNNVTEPASVLQCLGFEDFQRESENPGKKEIRRERADSVRIRCPEPGCESFLRRKNLPKHLRDVHEKLKKICECGSRVSFNNFKQHLINCHGDGSLVFKCPKSGCKSVFKSQVYLNNHISAVHVSKIKCPKKNCKARVKKVCLPEHMRQVHGMKIECINCGQLIMYDKFSDHADNCNAKGIRKFSCKAQNCDKVFKTQRHLATHRLAVHVESVKCPWPKCGLKLRKKSLRRHINEIHENLYDDECEFCKRKFRRYVFARHLKTCIKKETDV